MQAYPTECKRWKKISGIEEMIEEEDSSVKENIKAEKVITQNI